MNIPLKNWALIALIAFTWYLVLDKWGDVNLAKPVAQAFQKAGL